MYPILIVLAIGLAITVERWLHLTVAKTKNRHMIAKLMPLVAKGEVNSASQLASKSSATVSRILLQGIEHYKSARPLKNAPTISRCLPISPRCWDCWVRLSD
jgi:hypothetical protein